MRRQVFTNLPEAQPKAQYTVTALTKACQNKFKTQHEAASANESDWWLIKRAAVSQLWNTRCAPARLHNGSAG